MPNVTATPRTMSDGQRITHFIDSVGTTSVTYTYPEEQESITVHNGGLKNITVTVEFYTKTITPGNNWTQVVKFTSFSIVSTDGVQQFGVKTDESGNSFDHQGEKVLSEQISKLAQMEKQVDFVQLLQSHNDKNADLVVDIKADKNFGVAIPLSSGDYSYYVFKKNTYDDFIRLREGCRANIGEGVVGKANYDSSTGTVNTSSAPNYFGTLNSTITKTFTGTGIKFRSYADSRGGLWEFVVDGDTANKKVVSVWAEGTPPSNQWIVTTLFSGLTMGQHTVVGTFIGEDPAHPGGTRGWLYYHNESDSTDNYTFEIMEQNIMVNQFDVYDQQSVKEFAITIRLNGSTQTSTWMPQHGTNGTLFAENPTSQKIYMDGVEITNWAIQRNLNAKTVTIKQQMLGYNPADLVNPLVRVYVTHTINKKGVHLNMAMTALQDTYMGTGYPCMLPCASSFATNLITGLKETFATVLEDDSNSYIKGAPFSFVFTNDVDATKTATVGAMTVHSPYTTYMSDIERSTFIFVQHRSDDIQKLYIPAFQNFTFLTGKSYNMACTYYIGELPFAKNMLA